MLNIKRDLEEEKVKVSVKDCLEGLGELEDSQVDLVLTAPPLMSDEGFDTESYNYYFGFMNRVFLELYSKMKEDSTLVVIVPESVDYKGIRRPIFARYITLLENLGYLYTQTIVRDRGEDLEHIIVFRKGKIQSMDAKVLHIPSLNKNKGVEPLPIALVDLLIEGFSEEGDVVLDMFVGTGATALSSLKLGRYCIGYDNNDNLVDVSNLLVESYKKGMLR